MSGLTNARTLIERSRSNLSLGGLSFPADIDKVPHKTVMRFVKRSALQGGRTDLSPQEVNITNGFIVLPVPNQIIDGVSIRYSPTDIGISGEIIAGTTGAAASIINGGTDFRAVREAATNLASAENIGRLGVAGAQALGFNYGAQVINAGLSRLGVSNPQATAALALGLNKTLNPFTTATFQGVNLRTFSFSWVLAPKNVRESTDLEAIIRLLRRKSLPQVPRNTAGFFMEFPDTVEFNLIGMTSAMFTFPTSPCVVESISFNRTPTGAPVFFAGTGAPAFVEITMKLLEIRPLIRDDEAETGVNTNSLVLPRR